MPLIGYSTTSPLLFEPAFHNSLQLAPSGKFLVSVPCLPCAVWWLPLVLGRQAVGAGVCVVVR
jgi:hypothetical protein